MEPIVSPWFVYLWGVVDGVGAVFIGAMFVGIISSIALTAGIIGLTLEEKKTEEDHKFLGRLKVWQKRSVALLITSVLLIVFTPSSNTLVGIYAASKITTDSVQGAVDAGRDMKEEIKKDIIDILSSLEKKKKE